MNSWEKKTEINTIDTEDPLNETVADESPNLEKEIGNQT